MPTIEVLPLVFFRYLRIAPATMCQDVLRSYGTIMTEASLPVKYLCLGIIFSRGY